MPQIQINDNQNQPIVFDVQPLNYRCQRSLTGVLEQVKTCKLEDRLFAIVEQGLALVLESSSVEKALDKLDVQGCIQLLGKTLQKAYLTEDERKKSE
jgi:hypothetical protein